MRIGYLLNIYPKPSVTFIRREIQALERAGVEVHRFAMRCEADSLVDPGDLEEHRRTEYVLDKGVLRLLADLARIAFTRPRNFLRALASVWQMGARSHVGILRHIVYLIEAAHVARRADALGIQHIHAHFGTNAATVALLVARLGGPGYSFTVHGPEEFDSPEAFSLAEKIEDSAFTVAITSFARSQLFRWVQSPADERIHVVHCGIEPKRFDAPRPMAEGPLRLINIGRFAEQKGLLILLDALAVIRARGVQVELTLVGDGPLRPEIEAAIRRLGIADMITMTGWISEAGVRHELEESDILVAPSFAEGLPMVVMEAMAAGRPVIATYIAGNPELVLPGENGWLVPAGDVGALADAIIDASHADTERLVLMGAEGRRRVFQRHDIDTEAGKLAALFRAAVRA